jgi:hypothetical protein
MSEQVLIAVVGGAVTLGVGVLAAVVAIGVYRAGERARRDEARHEQQRLMVARMLDTIDDSIRVGLVPRIFRPSRSPELELTMALPRLLMDLPKDDLAVAEWAAGEVQRARGKVRRKDFVQQVLTVEFALISWHRGDLPLSWFKERLQVRQYQKDFRLPSSRRLLLWARDVFEGGVTIGSWAVVAISLRWVWRQK